MTYILTMFLLIFTALLPRVPMAAEPVYVAAYEFPPYYSSRLNTHITGELIKAVNAKQNTYQFILREIRPKDRFRALQPGGCCDLMLFESSNWGWPNAGNYHWGEHLTQGSYRYYTLRESLERGVTSFDPLRSSCVGGVFGFHYKYTEMQTETVRLESQFNFYTTTGTESLFNMLLAKRIDMVIIGDEYINWQRKMARPGIEQVVASERIDHEFKTRVVLNRDAIKQAEVLNALIREMKANGELAAILEQFGQAASLMTDEAH